jgi:hypothetical protein
MSYSTTNVLQMHFFTDANALEYLKKNLETDEDFNGNNGDEYLHPCAKGFNSNQDYYLTKAFKKNKVPMAINKFFMSLREDCFYEDIDYILNPTSDGYALSVMYVQN